MMRLQPLLAAAALIVSPAMASEQHAHGPHVHGAANLEVAVDGGILSIHLESPLANIVGFEHVPKTDKQRASAKSALALLKQGERLFVPTPAAGCKLTETVIEAPVLEGHADKDGHGDLDADYRFECARPNQLKGLDTRLFEIFSGMTRIDAAVVTGKGQQAYKLSPPMHDISW